MTANDTSNTPTVDDIDTARTQEIGQVVKDLSVGDEVRVTNQILDEYIEGVVDEKRDRVGGDELYIAYLKTDDSRWEMRVNWRDIPVESDDQQTPYTGLIEEPATDTANAITDIENLNRDR